MHEMTTTTTTTTIAATWRWTSMWMTKWIGISALLVSGCVSLGPSEALIEARQMRAKAQQTRAVELAPAQLREADLALAKAEAEHSSDAQSPEEKHYSYLATAKYQTAIAEGRRRDAVQREEVAHRRFFTEQAQVRRNQNRQISDLKKSYQEVQSLLQSTQSELDAVKGRIEAERDLEAAQADELKTQAKALEEQVQVLESKRVELEQALSERDEKLEDEREARLSAEQRASAALQKLNEIASVKAEAEETTITLTGEVLFASGESVLLPTARERLDLVADALKEQGDKINIVIEGHTDSKGTAQMNEQLSHARATAVKRYLVGQGVDEDRIHAVGRGESEPVATNGTAEGRANNRRVEIILRNGEA
jgi:outer membrane protein OmpA-like peptidoglycan-associated protein